MKSGNKSARKREIENKRKTFCCEMNLGIFAVRESQSQMECECGMVTFVMIRNKKGKKFQ